MATVENLNSLDGSLTISGAQNITITDNGSSMITIGGPGNSPFVTDEELVSVSGSLQAQIDDVVPGVWEVLSVEELSSSAGFITISGIAPRDYLKVFIDTNYDKTSGVSYYVRMNGDTSSNYTDETDNSFQNKAQISRDAQNNSFPIRLRCSMEISNNSSEVKSWTGNAFNGFQVGWSTNHQETFGGFWKNTSDSISSITLLTDTSDDFLSGSRIVVTGMNFS